MKGNRKIVEICPDHTYGDFDMYMIHWKIYPWKNPETRKDFMKDNTNSHTALMRAIRY